MDFSLSREIVKDTLVIVPSGALQSDSTDVLKEYIENLFRARTYSFVVDMTKVEYINSLGIGVLTWAHNRAQRQGGKVVLVGLSSKIKAIFQIAYLTNILHIYDTVEEAVDMILRNDAGA